MLTPELAGRRESLSPHKASHLSAQPLLGGPRAVSGLTSLAWFVFCAGPKPPFGTQARLMG